jgi:hypothetical protein
MLVSCLSRSSSPRSRPAAGEDDALVHDVGRQLGRDLGGRLLGQGERRAEADLDPLGGALAEHQRDSFLR